MTRVYLELAAVILLLGSEIPVSLPLLIVISVAYGFRYALCVYLLFSCEECLLCSDLLPLMYLLPFSLKPTGKTQASSPTPTVKARLSALSVISTQFSGLFFSSCQQPLTDGSLLPETTFAFPPAHHFLLFSWF